jgi:hypothetical protein
MNAWSTMSWTDKELRRREKKAAVTRAQDASASTQGDEGSAAEHMARLWADFEAVHNALPAPLQLKRLTAADNEFATGHSMFVVLLLAKNGAGIGYTGDGIRYIWPKGNNRRSNNFWIRWQPEQGLRLSRRVKPGLLRPAIEEHAFQPSSIEHIFKCLVTEQRVKYRAVRKRRFWLF